MSEDQIKEILTRVAIKHQFAIYEFSHSKNYELIKPFWVDVAKEIGTTQYNSFIENIVVKTELSIMRFGFCGKMTQITIKDLTLDK